MPSLTELHAIALQVAPDAAGALTLLEHQPDWPRQQHATAYAVAGRPLYIRDYLQSVGRWAGVWGSYIVFVVSPTVPTLLHELSHLLPIRQPVPDEMGVATIEQRQKYAIHMQEIVQLRDSRRSEPWSGHDARWIRRCIHLAHRAGIPLEEMNVAGPSYGLSMPENYRVELGAEPSYLSHQTFAEIAATPMPPRFARLFANDVAEWHFQNLIGAA